jgi:hypothetical protein
MRGWWNMACWEGLSPDQQEFLRTEGYLPFGYQPAGVCQNGAEVEVTTMWDEFPGPRFLCSTCAIAYLVAVTGAVASPGDAAARRRPDPGP